VKKDTVVFRQSKIMRALFILVCLMFLLAFLLVDTLPIWLVIAIMLSFGTGGAFVLFRSWGKALLIVSADGITIPNQHVITGEWRKQFIPWSNFRKIEVLEQHTSRGRLITSIGIFVTDERKVDDAKQVQFSTFAKKRMSGWKEYPAAMVPLSDSGINSAEVFAAVKKYHAQHYGDSLLEEVCETTVEYYSGKSHPKEQRHVIRKCEKLVHKEDLFIID